MRTSHRSSPADDAWTDSRLLGTVARLWEYTLNSRLASLNLTTTGLITLQALEGAGVTSQAALARAIRVKPQTLRRTLLALETKGFLTRSASDPSTQSVTVGITLLGRRAVSEARQIEEDSHTGLSADSHLRYELIMLIRRVTTN